MKTKALTAAQIDTLAQRLSENPIEQATSAKKAGENFARLLAAEIGVERAALAFTSIMTAETFEQAEARLTLVLDYGNSDPTGEPISTAEEETKAALAPAVGKPQAILDQAHTGSLPQPPDFSKPTHARHMGQPDPPDDLQLLRGRHHLEGSRVARGIRCRTARDRCLEPGTWLWTGADRSGV